MIVRGLCAPPSSSKTGRPCRAGGAPRVVRRRPPSVRVVGATAHRQRALLRGGLRARSHGRDPRRAASCCRRCPRATRRTSTAVRRVARAIGPRCSPSRWRPTRWVCRLSVRKGPEDDAESDALYSIAAAFAREGIPENAVECLVAHRGPSPGFQDVAVQVRRLEAGARSAVQDFARVLEEDGASSDRHTGVARGIAPGLSRPTRRRCSPAPTTRTTPAASRCIIARVLFTPAPSLPKRYRLEELIGQAAVCRIVYRATDLELKTRSR